MKDKKHTLVIEMSGFRREIEIEKPFSKNNEEVFAHLSDHLRDWWHISDSIKPTSEENYKGWAKLEIYVGGFTDYTDEDGEEAWENNPWEGRCK